ncbi:hypothetical protein [Streptomyces sp. NBC_01481]|uniref:hypothetical protein n=1 Tax=Streptomyces sp. NBC_01481 TaxID=2975869 RepID=UPI00225B7C41|nr:hypothetical protein [Streptomyces sp. NBC_01481]MCX4582391.1 hypothetical protein [Streptomyces sp. NBC_01481]
MSEPREPTGLRGTPAAVGRGLLTVLACAGPLLVAGGVAVAVGGARRNPWLIAVGTVMVLAAVVRTLRYRSRGGAGPEDCCPSVTPPSDAAGQGRPHGSDTEDARHHP